MFDRNPIFYTHHRYPKKKKNQKIVKEVNFHAL